MAWRLAAALARVGKSDDDEDEDDEHWTCWHQTRDEWHDQSQIRQKHVWHERLQKSEHDRHDEDAWEGHERQWNQEAIIEAFGHYQQAMSIGPEAAERVVKRQQRLLHSLA